MHDLLIRNGTVVTPDGVGVADVAVDGGRIVDVAGGPARAEIDATGLHVFPGLIDVHVHFNDPGRADWEGAATGSAALAAGGGTCFCDMPLNSSPPVLDGDSFDRKVAALTGNSFADFALWGGLTPANLDRMGELADRGVVGFKAFMADSGIDDFQRADHWTLEVGMRKAAKLGLPVAIHAEDSELVNGRTAWIAETMPTLTAREWVYTRTPLAEAVAINTALLIAQSAGCPLHVVHVSNRFCVELVHTFRSHADATVETCPQYFMLTAEDVERIGPAAKCAPPIRVAPHGDQLWVKVVDGTIDLISSDHSPAPPDMKSGDFFAAWGGVAGVQSTLAAVLTRTPRLPLERVAKLVAGTPGRRFGLPNKGRVAAGYDADLSLVDLSAEYELRREMLLDRHKLSPYVGMTFRGRVVRTILRGQTMFLDGKIVGRPIGRLVKPVRKHSDPVPSTGTPGEG